MSVAGDAIRSNGRVSARLLDSLFDLFDTDDDGVVDMPELAAGLSVLCGGKRDDKVEVCV